MSQLTLLSILAREVATAGHPLRVPEPEAVMDECEQVKAYVGASRRLGIMAPTYLFHSAQACEMIRPGDLVLDLACGPATQLAQMAHLNPESQFIGFDLSPRMLEQAQSYVEREGLSNVELRHGDITDLGGVANQSVGAVTSVMSLHHLPDHRLLDRTLAEIQRVLKPGGSIYLADFGRLRSDASMRYFAHQHTDRQPEAFTRDYWNSLRAAFSLKDFKGAVANLSVPVLVYSTFLVPFMVVIKGDARRSADPRLKMQLDAMRNELSPDARRDLKNLTRFFRLGGLRCPLLDE